MNPRSPYTLTTDLRTLEQRIINTLNTRGPSDIVELVRELAVSPRQVQHAVHGLTDRGVLSRTSDQHGCRVYRTVA